MTKEEYDEFMSKIRGRRTVGLGRSRYGRASNSVTQEEYDSYSDAQKMRYLYEHNYAVWRMCDIYKRSKPDLWKTAINSYNVEKDVEPTAIDLPGTYPRSIPAKVQPPVPTTTPTEPIVPKPSMPPITTPKPEPIVPTRGDTPIKTFPGKEIPEVVVPTRGDTPIKKNDGVTPTSLSNPFSSGVFFKKAPNQDLLVTLDTCKNKDEIQWFYKEYIKDKFQEEEYNIPIFDAPEGEEADSMVVLRAKIKKTLDLNVPIAATKEKKKHGGIFGHREYKALTDEEIDAITDRKKLLKEFRKFEKDSIPQDSIPSEDDSIDVLKVKLRNCMKNATFKKRKNFLEKGFDAIATPWKKAQRAVGGWVDDNLITPFKQGFNSSPGEFKDSISNYRAPNGLYIEKNDIDYLISQGYTEQQAVDVLMKEKKYTDKVDQSKIQEQMQLKASEHQKSGYVLSAIQAPNGLYYEQNDTFNRGRR